MSESARELNALLPDRSPDGDPWSGAPRLPAAALIEHALRLVADDLAATERHFAELLCSDIAVIPQVSGHVAFAASASVPCSPCSRPRPPGSTSPSASPWPRWASSCTPPPCCTTT